MLFGDPYRGLAQEQIHIYVGAYGHSKVPIALPPIDSSLPAAEELYSVKHDLELSGWVDVINPDTYLEKRCWCQRGTFRFEMGFC